MSGQASLRDLSWTAPFSSPSTLDQHPDAPDIQTWIHDHRCHGRAQERQVRSLFLAQPHGMRTSPFTASRIR